MAGITYFRFSWAIGAPKGGRASFADAQEYGREYHPPNV
jgi:hypothetical protein